MEHQIYLPGDSFDAVVPKFACRPVEDQGQRQSQQPVRPSSRWFHNRQKRAVAGYPANLGHPPARIRHPTGMKIGWCLLLALLVYPLSGCEKKPGTPADVKERAANATEELKQDTKAVAEGIREGWTRDKSQDTRDKSADARDKSLDINAASKEQLESLPGVTPAMAGRVVSHRP